MWNIVFLYDCRVGKHFVEKFIRNWKRDVQSGDGTPITDASLDLLALHSKYLSSISSKGCTKVDFELLSAIPLILLFIDDYKKLLLLHHELASSVLHAQLLLEKCFY